MKKVISFLFFVVACCTYKIDTYAGTNGDGMLANTTSLGNFEFLQIDKRNNLYGCDSQLGTLRIINGATRILSTFSPAPWKICSALAIDFNNDILFLGDECRVWAIHLLTGSVQVAVGTGQCSTEQNNGIPGPESPIPTPRSLSVAADRSLIMSLSGVNNIDTHRAVNASGIIFGISGAAIPRQITPFGSPRTFLAALNPLQLFTLDGDFFSTASNAFNSSGINNSTAEGLNVEDVLFDPKFIASDSKGNIYVTETNRVRIINSNLTVFTIAGSDIVGPGYSGDGGLATGATLREPARVVLDTAGNIYISDQATTTVRKIDAKTSRISSFAGNGFPQYAGDGGSALNAQLSGPSQMTQDLNGDFLFVEDFNEVIRRVSTTGIISTVAGPGTFQSSASPDGTLAKDAFLDIVAGIAVTNNGDILFTDRNQGRVRKVEKTTGKIVTIAGNTSATPSGDGGPAIDATLQSPFSLAIDSDENIYVCDQSDNRNSIRRIDHATSIITTIAAADIEFCFGIHVAFDGNIYVSDGQVHIYKISPSGTTTIFAGNGTQDNSTDGAIATQSPLNAPFGITSDIDGNVYFVDLFFVKKIDAKTQVISTVFVREFPVNVKPNPAELFYSKSTNALFMSDTFGNKILIISDLQNSGNTHPPIASAGIMIQVCWILFAGLVLFAL